MPIWVRGVATCDGIGCKRVATVEGAYSHRMDTEIYWYLPKGWLLFERGQNATRVYCSWDCHKGPGSPDRTGNGLPAASAHEFNARTIHKLTELLQARVNVSADDLLAAFEMVLLAWRRRGQRP